MRIQQKVLLCWSVAMAAMSAAQPSLANVSNGNFEQGIVYGSMASGPGAVSNWSYITNTPQVVSNGCDTFNGAIQMWGNLVVGESIMQSLYTPFVAGNTYSITIKYKHPITGPAPGDQVRFRLSASPAMPTVYPPTGGASYDVIGITPFTSSPTCVSHTFNWTAPRNASWIAINPENASSVNDGAFVSWGTIDDICVNGICNYGAVPVVAPWAVGMLSTVMVGAGCLVLRRRRRTVASAVA